MSHSAAAAATAVASAVGLHRHHNHHDDGHLLHLQDQDQKLTVPPAAYKWRLVLSYDGAQFSGWQYQPSRPTIQSALEQALTTITKLDRKDLRLAAAGRTDAGVHALGQVVHFVTPFTFDSLDGIHMSLNGILSHDIRVREVSAAVPEFHARGSATGKIYRYKIYNDAVMDPFHRAYAYHCPFKLNIPAMREAAMYFVGKHDFSAFANAQRQRDDYVINPVKDIWRVDIIEQGPLLQVEVEGSGFLYKQVRNMVALLVKVGKEAVAPDIVPKIMATRERVALASVTLPALPHGLSLVQVMYKEDHLRLPEGGPKTSYGKNYSVNICKMHFY